MKSLPFKKSPGYAALGTVLALSFIMLLLMVNMAQISGMFSKNIGMVLVGDIADTVLLSCVSVLREKVVENSETFRSLEFFPAMEFKFREGSCSLEVISETDDDIYFNLDISSGEMLRTARVRISKIGDLMELKRNQ